VDGYLKIGASSGTNPQRPPPNGGGGGKAPPKPTEPDVVSAPTAIVGAIGDGLRDKLMKPSLPAGTLISAIKTRNPLFLGSEEKVFPAVNILGYNWIKLRDFAMLLSGTLKGFAIGYDNNTKTISVTTESEYSPVGDELGDLPDGGVTAMVSPQVITLNGSQVEVAAYNINGYNYFRLRDLAIMLDFGIDYNEDDITVTLALAEPFSE
jgi:hypothetical protein